ncbi:hypothetical protein [Glycomyces terrestris]|uniref:Uncharacterized protein n=1 Tax=Glycomyces terrestris TaxID=2493553 RepID=A0A426UXY9_9ACTN|nr:hypothetical protein [Glycomyces terrestris]RRR99432.1 hypothetical protein EIW28_12030 [Glycomyces terrestris]
MTRTRTRAAVAGAALALLATAACDPAADRDEADDAVFYGLGDDHRLYRWEPGADPGEAPAAEPVLDLSGVWDAEGDVGTVLRATLTIDPRQRTAAWIEGASPNASLKFGDLETGEITTAAAYPLDHACIDPTWLADGSALLVHRGAVWGAESGAAIGDTTPMPVQAWGEAEWFSPEAGQLPTTVDLQPVGCRLRWYTAEDGTAQALYHNLDVSELYRIDAEGTVLETIRVGGLTGAEPLVIGLVGVDPTGRYACVVDDYGPYGAFKGGFTPHAEAGTRVIDLHTGEAASSGSTSSCTTLQADGYVSRDGGTASFVDYDGGVEWSLELPDQIKESPVLFAFAEQG